MFIGNTFNFLVRCDYISRVPDQNGVSLLYIMLEIHHSGREPSICMRNRPQLNLEKILSKQTHGQAHVHMSEQTESYSYMHTKIFHIHHLSPNVL